MVRGEIQGLRAVAVSLVLVFHTWPALVPGGFVGVDVFFVVSGFLITGLLLREQERTGAIDLPAFYARRVRRLLPAATLVLTLVVFVTPFVLSTVRWRDTAEDVIASALYAENWQLARRAVDYQAEGSAASPVQHYWSLSIEEQFYFVWPGLLVLLARLRLGRDGALTVLGVVLGGSFACSVFLTGETSAAYFVSHTRMWELAIGAALAAMPALSVPRPLLAVPGLAAIGLSAFVIDGGSAFPGWWALLPTLGCAMVLAAGSDGPVARLLSAAPLRWVGDRSYSIYLWHWPLAVWWTATAHKPGPLGAAVVTGATLALSAASYAFVEEPLRHPRPSGGPPAVAIGAASLVPIALACGLLYTLQERTALPVDDGDPRYPGAAVLFAGAVAPAGVEPALTVSANPFDCEPREDADEHVAACRMGDPNGKRVAVVGDSHAGHWMAALDVVGKRLGWAVEVHSKQACTPLLVPITNKGKPYETCSRWGRNVRAYLAENPPEILLFSHSKWARPVGVRKGPEGDAAMVAALREMWADYAPLGARMIAMPDVARWGRNPIECWERDPNCKQPVSADHDRPDMVTEAAVGTDVRVLDLRDLVCPDGVCRPVIGNVFVYRDHSHLGPLYTRTLAPEFERRLLPLLE